MKIAGLPPDLDSFLSYESGDDLGMVLRSHLALEVVLNRIFDEATPAASHDLDRLSFMLKVDVSIALRKVDAYSRPSFAIVNRIRNRFAHDLDAKITDAEADELVNSFPPDLWDAGIFRRSYFAALKGDAHAKVAFGCAVLYVLLIIAAGDIRRWADGWRNESEGDTETA